MNSTKFFVCALLGLMLSPMAYAMQRCEPTWPLWDAFAKYHIQADGRVIDRGTGGISTSEGQAYALFFSLVANDKQRFARILKWTNDNLAEGDLSGHLPAWKWGQHNDGSWRVLDTNSASDADLWIAYSLYQAAALWKERSYLDTASALLQNIAKQEVAVLPELGSMLLPAAYGFALDTETWRLNPSYLPIQLLRYFSTVDKRGAWNEIAANTFRMISATSNQGLVADWVLYKSRIGFQPDPERGKYSGYDSIRVYLWWAMLNQRDPLFGALRPYVSGAAQFNPGKSALPELVGLKDGNVSGLAPIGFVAALAPYRYVLYGQRKKTPASLEEGAGYYNYVLSLFGYGWLDRRYRFNPDGSLHVRTRQCPK